MSSNPLIKFMRRPPSADEMSQTTIRFLVVDDHDAFRLILRQMVESHPHWSVLAEARDGCEAIHLAQLHSPDVILMDVVMPNMNGIEAARQIHQLVSRARIILFSAYHEEEFVLSGTQAGAVGLIWKDQLNESSLEDMVDSPPSPESVA